MLAHGQDIDKIKNDPEEEYFLLCLCHSVDLECRFLFQSFFRDILSTGINTYSINLRQGLRRRNDDIEKIFHGLKRGNTSAIKFPSNSLALVHSHSQQQQLSDGRSRGGRNIIPPAAKRLKHNNNEGEQKLANTHKPKSDAWSAPERVTNPMATYFPDTPEGNVSKTRVAKIKFDHHATKDGSRDRAFVQSSICLPF